MRNASPSPLSRLQTPGYPHQVSENRKEGVETLMLPAERYIYNAATKEFAVVNRSGKLVTYHRIRPAQWRKFVRQYAPK